MDIGYAIFIHHSIWCVVYMARFAAVSGWELESFEDL